MTRNRTILTAGRLRHFPRQLLRPQLEVGADLELEVVLVVRQKSEVVDVEQHQ